MMALIMYDISTADAAGRRRLRSVAKKCADWGVAVQNSVYECQMNNDQFLRFKAELESLIQAETDSIRFYNLGNSYQNRITRIGKERTTWDRETFIL